MPSSSEPVVNLPSFFNPKSTPSGFWLITSEAEGMLLGLRKLGRLSLLLQKLSAKYQTEGFFTRNYMTFPKIKFRIRPE